MLDVLWAGESETVLKVIGLEPDLVLIKVRRGGASELVLLDILEAGESETSFDLLDALGAIRLEPGRVLLDTLKAGESETSLDLLDALGAIGLDPGLVLLDIPRIGESEPWLELLDALGAIGLDPGLVLLDIPRIGESEPWPDILDALGAIELDILGAGESETCLVLLGTTGERAEAFSLVGRILTEGLTLLLLLVWVVAEEISSVLSLIFQTIPWLASTPT